MTDLERPLSSLSISSSSKSLDLDWDNQSSPASANSAPVTPSPRRRRLELPNVDGTPTPMSRLRTVDSNIGARIPIADLVRIRHDGDKESSVGDHHLTQDEERRLREALDNWVNSADDDLSFHAGGDSVGSESPSDSRTRSPTVHVVVTESSPTTTSSAERQTCDESTKESGHA